MPKAKPTQVIVHRIELQQSERDALEAALAGRFVTNAVSATGSVLTGVGNFLAPFSGVFGALAALWIGDRTLDAVRRDAEDRKIEIEEGYAEGKSVYDTIISAWLNTKYAEGGWDAVCSQQTKIDLMSGQFNPFLTNTKGLPSPIPQFYFDELLRFLDFICNEERSSLGNVSPGEYWVQWMNEDKYGQAAYYYDTNGSTWEAFKKGIGTFF